MIALSEIVDWTLTLAIVGATSGLIGFTVALIGTILSNKRTQESNAIASAAFDANRIAKEAEFIEKYKDLVYRSSYGKEIIEACKNHKPVLQSNGGSISERDLENFLNDLQHPFVLASQQVIRASTAYASFAWVMERIHDSPEILNFIQGIQTKYTEKYWQRIVDFKKNNGF